MTPRFQSTTLVAGPAVVAVAASLLSTPVRTQSTAPPPAFDRAPDALERVTWRTRTMVADGRLTGWKLALRPDGLPLLDAIVRADAVVVNFVEGRSGQPIGTGFARPLDGRLSADEIADVRARMGTMRLLTYRVDPLPADAAARRQVVAFAKAIGAETVLVGDTPALPLLGAEAEAAGLTIAVLATPRTLADVTAALRTQPARIGVGLDTGAWLEAGRLPADALATIGDRLRYVNLRDRAALGTASRNVPLGEGVGQMAAFFDALERRTTGPLALTLDTAGLDATPAGIGAAVDAFERVVQPAYGRRVTAFSATRPVRWDLYTPPAGTTPPSPEEIATRAAEARRRIEAALPRQPQARPRRPRTLLVVESLLGMSHDTIPLTNVMLERFGAATGAWTAVFDNDLANLRYPAIKAYDAIFLNDIVGEAFAEPAVRDGILRYVKEGGGVAGIHGTPWASRNWTAFADLIGAMDAPHRIEQGVLRVYDPSSPLVASLGGRDLPFQEEYYRFHTDGARRLRWSDVRVLLTVALDDPAIEPRPWTGYKRPDGVYPVSWIRTCGKGRVFYTSIGHLPETFMTPSLVGHMLAGVQYALGDLDADATPNPRPSGSMAR
jgi:type 1 glutamine amidotransferase